MGSQPLIASIANLDTLLGKTKRSRAEEAKPALPPVASSGAGAVYVKAVMGEAKTSPAKSIS